MKCHEKPRTWTESLKQGVDWIYVAPGTLQCPDNIFQYMSIPGGYQFIKQIP